MQSRVPTDRRREAPAEAQVDAASCFPATGNIHWYKYTLTNDALVLTVNAAGTLGTTSDYAMTYDKMDNVLYLFETETDTAGRIVRLQ